MKGRSMICGVLGGMTILVSTAGRAQDSTPAAVSTPTANPGSVPASRGLDHIITLHLRHVSLRAALTAIGTAAGVPLVFSENQIPAAKTVTLVANAITVEKALRTVLQNTKLSVFVSRSGAISLEPGPTDLVDATWQQGTATIVGYVHDSATGTSLPGAIVRVDGTTLETKSDASGTYHLTGVAAGEYRVTVRHLGYLSRTRVAVVADGQTVTVNFFLNQPATKLDEVVTTAMGVERRYVVGNDIATVNVDSIAPTAPVTNVEDLIAARAPGVQVVSTSGMVGSGGAIRIWGQSSMAIQSDPIIVVDGIRQDNGPGGSSYSLQGFYYGGNPSPNRLDDLDYSQIATIDILKGPAATTAYGTAGANGVIVITTKRGTSGAPQWHASAEQSASAIPIGFPNYYTSWGHATDGSAAPTYCPVSGGIYLNGAHSINGNCVVDSVTAFNPLNRRVYSPFGTGPSGKYDVDVGGGSQALRYYVAAGFSHAIGGTQLPPIFRSQAVALGFPNAATQANTQQQYSLRVNTQIQLAPTADLQVNMTYMTTDHSTPGTSNNLLPRPALGGSPPDSANNYGYGTKTSSPLYSLGTLIYQRTSRFDGGLTANWRPLAWLVGHLTVGVDHGTQTSQEVFLPQSQSYAYTGYTNGGEIAEGQGANDVYTVNLNGAATVQLTSAVRAVTTTEVDLTDNATTSLQTYAYGLSAADFQFNGAPGYGPPTAGPAYAVTLGGSVQEVVSLADRLFVTGALRVDAGSGFGRHYNETTYPNVQVSWLAVQGRTMTFRLRGAAGSSGTQPPYGSQLQEFVTATAQGPGISANPVTGFFLTNVGNQHLTPERSAEYEGGFDASFLQSRLSVTFTGYSKTTYNALYNQSLGWETNDLTYEENLGEIRNTGVNGSLTAVLMQGPMVNSTVTINTSVNTNKLVSLAPGVPPQETGYAQYFEAGYPLYGFWGEPVKYTDLNHDGLIEADEVSGANAPLQYLGAALPKQETSLLAFVGLWRNLVAISALFDYQGDFRVYNVLDQDLGGFNPVLEENNVLTAPLWMQARAQTPQLQDELGPPSDFFENGSFVRFRELSLTVNLPKSWARAGHVAQLGLTGAVRNLALWTRYTNGDPEVSDQGIGQQTNPGTGPGTATVNNDNRGSGFGAIPLTRNWTVRLNVEF